MSIDLSARRLLMASLAYYGLDQPFMTDAAYDELSREVAAGWKGLGEARRFMLGSAEEVLTSGNFFKITMACAAATATLLGTRLVPSTKWKSAKLIGRWLPPTEFREA